MAIKYYNSPKQALLFLGIDSLCTVGCIFMVWEEPENWGGWACLILFSFCIPVGLRLLLDRRPRITIDEEGVEDRTLKVGKIRWEYIKGYYMISINKEKFVCLMLDADYEKKLIAQMSKIRQSMASGNVALGAQRINLNLSSVAFDEEELSAEMDKRVTLIRFS